MKIVKKTIRDTLKIRQNISTAILRNIMSVMVKYSATRLQRQKSVGKFPMATGVIDIPIAIYFHSHSSHSHSQVGVLFSFQCDFHGIPIPTGNPITTGISNL